MISSKTENKTPARSPFADRRIIVLDILVFLLALVLATVFFAFLTGDGSAENRPPAQGDWVIDGDIPLIENEELELNGNIIVQDSGNLVLMNTKLTFNCSYDGEFGITINGGRLRIRDTDLDHTTPDDASVVRSENPEFAYYFRVNQGSTLELENSKIQDCGFAGGGKGDSLGPWVESNNVEVTGNNFSSNLCGLVLYKSSGVNIANNTFYKNVYGMYLFGSDKNTIYGNVFDSNSYGIYFQQKANTNTITHNGVSNSKEIGIFLQESNFNAFEGNRIFLNNWGVYMDSSTDNVLRSSNISLNSDGVVFYKSDDNRIVDGYAQNLNRCFVFNESEGNDIENYDLHHYNETNGTFLCYLSNGSYGNKLINTDVNLSRVFCQDSSLDLSIRLSVNTKDSLYQPIEDCDLNITQKNLQTQLEETIYASPGFPSGTNDRTDANGFVKDIVLKNQELLSDNATSSNGTDFKIYDYEFHATVKKDDWQDSAKLNTSSSYTHVFIKLLSNVVVVDKNGLWNYTTLHDALQNLKTDPFNNTIFVHNGVYNETKEFELSTEKTDNARIIGESQEGVLIKPGPGHPEKYHHLMGCYINGTGIQLKNLTFQGWEYGIYIEGSHSVHLSNVSLLDSSNPTQDGGWVGIAVYSSSSCTFSNLFVDGCDVGIFVSDSPGNTFEENFLSWNSEKNLVLVEFSEGNIVEGNIFFSSTCGVYLSESSGNSFGSNHYQDNLYGVYVVKNSNENSFRNETFINQVEFFIANSTNNEMINLTLASEQRIIASENSEENYLINPLTSVNIASKNGKIVTGFFMGILVLDENDEVTPVGGVDVKVVNNGETVYATERFLGSDRKTDGKGTVRMIEVYNGSREDEIFTPHTTEIFLEYGSWSKNYTTVINSSRNLIFLENQRPTVEITTVTKVRGRTAFDVSFHEGELMIFKAEGVDDGEALEYNWSVRRKDGMIVYLPPEKEFEIRLDSTNLSNLFGYGEHTIYVRVRDKFGLWSEADSHAIEVMKQEGTPSTDTNLFFILGVVFGLMIPTFGLLYFILYNKLKYVTRVEDMFVIYEDGRQIHHETRRLKPVFESELISSMFTAVQDFIGDSFKDEKGVLGRLDYGELQILVERGEHLFAAVVLTGDVPDTFRKDLKNLVHQIETEFSSPVEKWSGDAAEFRGIREVIQDQFYSKLEKKSVWLYIKDTVGKKASKKPGKINDTTDEATGTTPESEGGGEMSYGDENKPRR